MRTRRIIYWITTVFIFLFEGLMSALTSHTELAKEGIRSLGYPEYFGFMLMIFKVTGALCLLIPQLPRQIKEWAYAGFAVEFIAATWSIVAVKGWSGEAFFPLFVFAVLGISYFNYTKLHKEDE